MACVEVRPCAGLVGLGDYVVANETRRNGYFTVRKAREDERPLGKALSNSHALGFVALTREGVHD